MLHSLWWSQFKCSFPLTVIFRSFWFSPIMFCFPLKNSKQRHFPMGRSLIINFLNYIFLKSPKLYTACKGFPVNNECRYCLFSREEKKHTSIWPPQEVPSCSPTIVPPPLWIMPNLSIFNFPAVIVPWFPPPAVCLSVPWEKPLISIVY